MVSHRCLYMYSWYEVLRIYLYFNSKSILPLGISSLLQTHKHGILLEDSGRDAYQHIRMQPWNLYWVSIPSDYSLVYIGVASGFRPECLGKLLLAPSPSQLNIIRFCRLSLQRPGRIKTILSLHMRDPMFWIRISAFASLLFLVRWHVPCRQASSRRAPKL